MFSFFCFLVTNSELKSLFNKFTVASTKKVELVQGVISCSFTYFHEISRNLVSNGAYIHTLFTQIQLLSHWRSFQIKNRFSGGETIKTRSTFFSTFFSLFFTFFFHFFFLNLPKLLHMCQITLMHFRANDAFSLVPGFRVAWNLVVAGVI